MMRTLSTSAAVAAGIVSLLMLIGGAGQEPKQSAQDRFSDRTAFAVKDIANATTIVVEVNGVGRQVGLLGLESASDTGHEQRLKLALHHALLGERVWLIDDANWAARDDGVPLAYVYRAPDGLAINEELVRQGYAKAVSNKRYEQRSKFREHERTARAVRKGVWSPQSRSEPEQETAGGGDFFDRADARGNQGTDSPRVEEPQPRVADEGAADGGPPAFAPGSTTVYVTKSGSKYHWETCRFLSKSKRPMSLRDATQRYEPCRVCNPPKLRE